MAAKPKSEKHQSYQMYLPPSLVQAMRRRAAELTLKDGRGRALDWQGVARELLRKALAD